jgi:hypothetical protein
MNFYNGQWLIKDFGKLWPNIRFEYAVCIFLLLRSIVTLGINDGYVMCSRCLQCCNRNLELATKAKACKGEGQEGSLGVWESVRMNTHIPK